MRKFLSSILEDRCVIVVNYHEPCFEHGSVAPFGDVRADRDLEFEYVN